MATSIDMDQEKPIQCTHTERYIDPADLCCRCQFDECGCMCRIDNNCFCTCAIVGADGQ